MSPSVWVHALRAAQLAAVVLLSLSLFWTERVPVVLKVATAGLALLAALRPADALIMLAGLVPFSHVIVTRLTNAYPLALGEAWVLAFLAGYRLHTWRHRPRDAAAADLLLAPAWLVAFVVLASAAVQVVVVRVWHDYPLAYARTFLVYLARDYLTTVPDPRPWVEGQGFVTTAASLLEGVALLMATRALGRARSELPGRLLRIVVIAGSAAALLNLEDVAEGLLRHELSVADALAGPRRWTMFIPSLNTSGPYFALVAFVAFGIAATARRKAGWIGAGLLVVAAMWLTGTRSARVAGVATAGALILWVRLARARRWTPARAATVASLAALALAVAIVATNPFGILAIGAYQSLDLRVLLARTAVRIWTTHPWFGIGVGQYGLWYPSFAAPELRALMPQADAHNYFLWIAAELGLVGLGAFVWFLGAAAWLVGGRLLREPHDVMVLALSGGLAAFILTWLTGQPLSVPAVGCTFWILLGLAAGDRPAASVAGAAHPSPSACRVKSLAMGALAAAILVSVPIRARQAIADIDLARVTYGFYGWDADDTGTRYRWTGRRATLFVRATVRSVTVPLRAFDPRRLGLSAFEVEIFVNRRLASRARLTDDEWRWVRVPAPPRLGRARFWRIDLRVSPTWRPATTLPGSTDPRDLGVMVGETESIP